MSEPTHSSATRPAGTARFGMTVPFDGLSLAQHRDVFSELEELGYSDFWSSEAMGTDAFTPLALAAAWTTRPRLGTAIIPAATRGPALMAQSIAALAEAAPGRVVAGIGTSSNVIVQNWNAVPFEQPYQRTRDTVRFLRVALTGEKVDHAYETFTVKGFKLGRVPEVQPQLLIAGLRPGMLRLAGAESDGAILNWLSAADVPKVAAIVHDAAADAAAHSAQDSPASSKPKEIVARLFVCPNTDTAVVRKGARMAIAAYLNVPVYAAFHEWLGNGPRLSGMWDAWKVGDRKAALEAIPDEVVDDLIIHGSVADCRAHIQRYVANGVTTPVLAILPFGVDPIQAARDLAPRA
jgi:probable F420-dependent oxidoreductase